MPQNNDAITWPTSGNKILLACVGFNFTYWILNTEKTAPSYWQSTAGLFTVATFMMRSYWLMFNMMEQARIDANNKALQNTPPGQTPQLTDKPQHTTFDQKFVPLLGIVIALYGFLSMIHKRKEFFTNQLGLFSLVTKEQVGSSVNALSILLACFMVVGLGRIFQKTASFAFWRMRQRENQTIDQITAAREPRIVASA